MLQASLSGGKNTISIRMKNNHFHLYLWIQVKEPFMLTFCNSRFILSRFKYSSLWKNASKWNGKLSWRQNSEWEKQLNTRHFDIAMISGQMLKVRERISIFFMSMQVRPEAIRIEQATEMNSKKSISLPLQCNFWQQLQLIHVTDAMFYRPS